MTRAWAVCKADMLIKGENAENIRRGDTFCDDQFSRTADGERYTFDYMLANPPFGVTWKQQEKVIKDEADKLGYDGRFGAGLPRVNDGSLLFLQHMIAKMRPPADGGSRIGIVFNGSPLFTGDAGSGESEIRRWIIENDWLEAIVALPEQLFYNTGISTYLWILTNRKIPKRKGKIQLIDGRNFWVPMKKSLGNKRRKIGDPKTGRPEDARDPDHIGDLSRLYANFHDGETRTFPVDGAEKDLVVSKVFDNEDFGFHKITVERPLRLNFQASGERIARLDDESGFSNLATSNKKNEEVRLKEIAVGQARQEEIRRILRAFDDELYTDRAEFLPKLQAHLKKQTFRPDPSEMKAVLNALSERDETAAICRDRSGEPEPDANLRDTESVPLKESIVAYFEREVLPHVPDAWIDESKTKVGYEIPLNRHFYRYEPPRPLEAIEGDIKQLEGEILDLLKEVTA